MPDPDWIRPRHREVLHTLADGEWWTQVQLTQAIYGPYGEVVRSARELAEHGMVEYSDSDGAPAYRIVGADAT